MNPLIEIHCDAPAPTYIFCYRKRVASSGSEELSDPATATTEKIAKMSVKKMINDVDKVVDEALDALVKTNPGVNGIAHSNPNDTNPIIR